MPSSALSSEIARLRPLPPPSPGMSGKPGSATPSHTTPAKVAVVASPADSSADRALESVGKTPYRRLFSMTATHEGLVQTSAGIARDGFPRPSEQRWENGRNAGSGLARGGPEVEIALGRVAVDLGELVVREG